MGLGVDKTSQTLYIEFVQHHFVLMTSISFTSGEIMDIIDALEVKEDKSYLAGDVQLAAYYMQLVNQFQRINDRLSERPGEHRVAELVLAG
jgi:hypothetical protein